MKKIIILLFYALSFVSMITYACKDITLIHIGDLHGHLIARPNLGEGEHNKNLVGGLAYVYDQITKIRDKHPHHLLINTGDTIQGGVETLFTQGGAMVDILNQWQIDAFAPGNWDFIYGSKRFIELFGNRQGASPKANWNGLAANLYYATLYQFPQTAYAKKAGTRVLEPLIIKKINDLKIGIIGLTAIIRPQAAQTHIMDGFFITPGNEELQAAILHFKQQQVDLSLLISARGLAANLQLVERYPGIDIVLSSGMHEATYQIIRTKTGTLLIEEGQDGVLLGQLNLEIHNRRIINYQWQAHRINTKNNQADAKVLAQISAIRKPFIKGAHFVNHVNPINGAVLRTPIDNIIGYSKIALHRANFSQSASPAVIEGSSHNFLADAFKSACDSNIGIMPGFRYGTHIRPGAIKLEDIYHYIPIGAQIACGLMSGDQLREQIKQNTSDTFTHFIDYWDKAWLTAYSGITYDLNPYHEYGHRVTNIRINGDPIDLGKMYSVAGYWYPETPHWINQEKAINIHLLKNNYGGFVDATEIITYYLQTLPNKEVNPSMGRIYLQKKLPLPIFKNNEIQPLRGAPRPEY